VNPRQRRGVLLMAVATLGALIVFVSVLSYVASVREEVGELVTALQLSEDVDALDAVDEQVWQEVQVPRRWMPDTAITDPRETLGLVAGTALPSGSFLQRGMLVEPPTLSPGQREIAILIDAETGVGGKVRPGSVVDIYATFTGDPAVGLATRSDIIVTNALVLQVGQPTSAGGEGFSEQDAVPITFALSIEESLALTFAESFADKVRLAIVGGGDRTPLDPEQRTFDGGLAAPGKPAAGAR
jgi:Flp pilus assembly protein CpaB